MKKNQFKWMLLLLFSVMISSQVATAQIGPVVSVSETAESLPGEIKSFLTAYFPNAKVASVELETMDNMYEIKLDNGYELEFLTSGAWQKIEAPKKMNIERGVAEAILPEVIYLDLKKHHAEDHLRELKLCKEGYKIEVGKKKIFYYDPNGALVDIVDKKKDKDSKR